MKIKSLPIPQLTLRLLFAFGVCSTGVLVALAAFGQGNNRSMQGAFEWSGLRVHVTHGVEPFTHRSPEILSENEQAAAPAPVTRSSFMARWESVPGASGYRLDVSTSPAFDTFVEGYHDADIGKATGRVVTGLRRGTTYYYRVRAYNDSGSGASSATTTVATESSTGLIISPTFDSSILNDPNAAAIEAMINRAISIYESLFNDPITVQIAFRWTTAADPCGPIDGLAQSCTAIYDEPWNTYINALRADGQTSNDNTANASLPSSMLSSNVAVSSANGRAVGLSTPGTLQYHGGTYDGTVTLNSTESFQFTRPVNPNNFDAQQVTEHEIDEVIGLGSDLNVSSERMPQDLFSWSSAGLRSYSTSGTRYFSINGGTTNIVSFNQDPSGDLGDWFSEDCPQAHPYVQNAFGCQGQSSDIAATSPEGVNLDVIGYDLGTTSVTPSAWAVRALGDFNRDGKPDYALYNGDTRQTAIWYLNNNAFVSGAYGPTLPAGWSLVAVGDFNGDGKPDFVLSNASTRQTAIWYLNNNAFISGAYGPTLPAGWNVTAVGDFNGDGKPDFVLSNASTRQTAIWYLNNNTFIS
ncbi:MAG: NF038122 family metalloprotease, partial [Chthoniobacterales bacterium]